MDNIPAREIFAKILINPFRAAFLSFAVGALASLSMAPLNAWPVLFIALPVLYASLVYSPSGKRAFAMGWLFGFGYFVFSLSWIGNALLVEGNPYKWAWPLAVSGLPALLAFFPALASLASNKLLNLRSVSGWLGFVSMICGFEWLRGHVFTGFPWNLFGYTWADHLPVLQVLWLSDVYMLTWLTVLWASALGAVIFMPKNKRAWPISVALGSFIVCYAYGLAVLPDSPPLRDDLNIRVVQPNIDQAEKWQRDQMAGHFQKHLRLSENNDDSDKQTIIVWPETAVSYRLLDAPQAMANLKTVLSAQPPGSVLLTGFLRFDASTASYGNSLVMIDQNSSLSNIYDKHHLVPFGEYIPFQKWIPLAPVVQFKGFEAGPGLKTYRTPSGMRYSPLICYEIIFPGRSIKSESTPDFIVNVTNDAWYGDSAGPHQHLVQTVFRSIESGVPAIRSANTGFSAIISPYGHFIHKTQLFETTRFDSFLPQNRNVFFDMRAYKPIFPLIFLLFFILQGTYTQTRYSKSG